MFSAPPLPTCTQHVLQPCGPVPKHGGFDAATAHVTGATAHAKRLVTPKSRVQHEQLEANQSEDAACTDSNRDGDNPEPHAFGAEGDCVIIA